MSGNQSLNPIIHEARHMEIRHLSTIALLCLLVSTSAEWVRAQECQAGRIIRSGFMSGEECLQLDEISQRLHMAGFINGLLVSRVVGASETCLSPVELCLTGVTDSQMAAVLRKWLNAHPESWHLPCNLAAWRAVKEMCLKDK